MSKLKATQQSETGKNIRFTDTSTGRSMTLAQAVKAVDRGDYPDYHVRHTKNGLYIASNPDGNKKNNLG